MRLTLYGRPTYILLHCYTGTLLHYYIATLLHCYIATLLHCYIATLLHCYTVEDVINTVIVASLIRRTIIFKHTLGWMTSSSHFQVQLDRPGLLKIITTNVIIIIITCMTMIIIISSYGWTDTLTWFFRLLTNIVNKSRYFLNLVYISLEPFKKISLKGGNHHNFQLRLDRHVGLVAPCWATFKATSLPLVLIHRFFQCSYLTIVAIIVVLQSLQLSSAKRSYSDLGRPSSEDVEWRPYTPGGEYLLMGDQVFYHIILLMGDQVTDIIFEHTKLLMGDQVLDMLTSYLIFVTGTTGVARVKNSVRCKFFQIERKKTTYFTLFGVNFSYF